MDSEDEENDNVICGPDDPLLNSIDFSIKEPDECITKVVIAEMFRDSIKRLNQVSFKLSSSKAKRKLSGEDKRKLSDEVSEIAKKIHKIMCNMNLNIGVNNANHSHHVLETNNLNCESQFSVLDGFDCSVSDQSQTINPILDGLDCLVSIQSQTINSNIESTDSRLDGFDCITSVAQSQTINPILDGFDCLVSNQSQTINLNTLPSDCILDGLDCITSVAQPQTININNRISCLNDHTYNARNHKRVKLTHNFDNTSINAPGSSTFVDVGYPVTNNSNDNTVYDHNVNDRDQTNGSNLNDNQNSVNNPDENRSKRKRRRRRYGDLQRIELQNAFNKIDKLKRSIHVYAHKQEDLITIKKHIIQCDKYKDGFIDIDDVICNHKGRVTIICHKEDMVDLVQIELRKLGFNPIKPKINNFLLCLHGIPVKMKDEEIMDEIFRNKKFNKENIRIADKFRNTNAAHSVVFSVSPDLIETIINKPNFHIKGKKYNLFYFVKLIQCFNCADFGHFGINCSSNPRCINCGGNHDKTKCSDHNYEPKCANCTKQNSLNTNHTSWDIGCPYRKRFIQLNRIRFNYG